MLVRRQARALEIVAGMAVGGFLTTDLQRRICKGGSYRKFWQSNGCTSVGTDGLDHFRCALARQGGTALEKAEMSSRAAPIPLPFRLSEGRAIPGVPLPMRGDNFGRIIPPQLFCWGSTAPGGSMELWPCPDVRFKPKTICFRHSR